MLKTTKRLATVSAIALMASLSTAGAQAVRSGFDANTLAPNDDDSTGLVDIGFDIDFFGVITTQLFVNNNGNVTLDDALSTFTPFDLTSAEQLIIAPFFGDVDTSDAGDPVTYGLGEVGGLDAFGVNWVNVDYYSSDPSHTNRNSFQLILIDNGSGDFTIEFNYDQIQWEAGTASDSDENGLGGDSARVGYSNGTGDPGTFFELAGSAVNGAFLDTGPAGTVLVLNSLDSDVPGRYVFFARDGQVGVVFVPGNDGGIMATETAVAVTEAQFGDLRQVVRANAGARHAVAEGAGSMVMSQNGPSTADFSVWARIGGGFVNADFGDDLDISHFLGQAGIEAGVAPNFAVGVSIGGALTSAETADEDLDGDAIFVQPYVAFIDGGLTVIASVSYTYTDYDDSTDIIDSGDRYSGSLSVAYDVPIDEDTTATPFGFIAGGIEKLDAAGSGDDIDFIIGRVGVEFSHMVDLLNSGTMHVFASVAGEYVSANEPEISVASLLVDYDDSRFGGFVETGLNFTIAGTDTQLFASVNGSGLFTDAPGVGGRVGLTIPF